MGECNMLCLAHYRAHHDVEHTGRSVGVLERVIWGTDSLRN